MRTLYDLPKLGIARLFLNASIGSIIGQDPSVSKSSWLHVVIFSVKYLMNFGVSMLSAHKLKQLQDHLVTAADLL
jgi:hypothetical protein